MSRQLRFYFSEIIIYWIKFQFNRELQVIPINLN